jgi:hypothetical protein
MIYAIALIILGSCDPALATLFTPQHPQLGRYEVCTTSEPIEVANAGGGPIETLEALDAFGAVGTYDRAALARLYGGTRVRVARSWADRGDRFESVTRLSPYPDASLTHLNPGTMEIRWTLRRSTQNPQSTQSQTPSASSASSAFNVVTR